MPINLNQLFELLDEEVIARTVSINHDRAREQYPLGDMVINSFQDFEEEITLYYQYHFAQTIGGNGAIMADEAAAWYARSIVEGYFRRRGEGLNPLETGYRTAVTGTNGGIRFIINLIADSLKRSQEEQYIEHVINTNIDPTDYNGHINLMREYIQTYSQYISDDIRLKPPELLAVEYKQLIKLHVEVINRMRNPIAVY